MTTPWHTVALHESAGIIAVALCWRGVVRLPAEARGPWRLIAVAIAGFAVLDVGYAVFSTSAHDTFGTTERTGRAFRCADRRGSSGSNATRGAAMTDRTSANDLEDHRPRQISELLGGGRTVAMVMTMVGDHHSSRPVTCVEVTDTRLSFLVSLEVDWVTDIAAGRAVVHVTVADEKANTYVSLEGSATVVHDTAEIRRLWTPPAKVWFDGPDDPALAVLRFDVAAGQYWDGPSGSIRQGISLVRAMIEGEESILGTSGPVRTS